MSGSAAPALPAPGAAAGTGRGVALFLLALLCFAGYDAFAKAMVARHPPALVNLSRYIAVSGIALAWLLQARNLRPWRQPHQGLLLLRSVMLAITATSFMTALVTMPLAEATAIYFAAPLVMVALSPWLLGEQPTRRQWAAVLAGFAGMLLIVRPGSALPLAGTALMAVAALCYALFQVLTRKLSGRVAPSTQFAYMASLCLVITYLPALLGPPPAWPGWPAMALLLAGGVLSGMAQLLLLAAFRRAPLATLAPLNYLQLLLAVLISSFWFQRPPDGLALAGMAVIAVAGVSLARAARRPGAASGANHTPPR
ncbi:DMT family transporter [Aquabacterium sp. OR-4]|uniref:DMT family transporter n=1 Tax=Aquabacterium sp. OR-4 TaxID=2978127 RepID=UPI0021B27530|nr:DMT family transporter [Aquabacterium sp. OR-4]MDT7838332.1 DMT family transporter [Aquabacterium sp. OR-4]